MRDRRLTGPAGFTRLLLARGERAQVPLPLTRQRVPGGAPRVHYMAEAVKKDALGWLFRSGGWQRRVVVTAGRRREGRLTCAGIFERLEVRFTSAPLLLLVAAMEDAAALPAIDGPLAAALAGGVGSTTQPAVGDLVAVHRIVSALVRDAASAAATREVPADVLAGPLRQLRAAVPGCRRAWVVGQGGSALATDEDAPEDAAWALTVQQSIASRPPDPGAGWTRVAAGVLLRALAGPARAWVAIAVEPRAAGLRAALDGAQVAAAEGGLVRALGRGTPRAVIEARRKVLVRSSPLTRVFSAEELGTPTTGATGTDEAQLAAAAARLGPLVAGDRAVLWTYLDRAVARAWVEEEADRLRAAAPDALPRYAAAARGVAAFARAAISAGRPDALRPLVRFFQGYVLRFGNRAPVVEALRERARAFDRASEREAFLGTAARLFGACRLVTATIEQTLHTPVIDRTEEEKVLLGDYHDGFKEVAEEMEAMRRELAGEIG